MCGIAGYILNKYTESNYLHSMLNAIIHRGPDSEGVFESKSYHAGMRRLMINDLKTGNQPLYNEDQSIILFYNGEIYNYKKLKQDLIKKRHIFYTESDGEVICHLYEEYGYNLFEKLDGMFALALWNNRTQELLLARDIPGEKPLYYSELSQNEIVFASEIKCFKEFKFLKLKLNKQAIWDFPTFLWIPEPDTIYENVKALMPGQFLKINKNGIRIYSYPNLFCKSVSFNNQIELIQNIRNIVEENIKSRLLSDVPIGCFLSSGLDSSIITTIAAKYIKNLSTFTIGFEDMNDPYHGRSDESKYAELYARHLGTEHHTIKVTANDFLKNLPAFCKHGDQPFGVSSGLGILSIAEAAKNVNIKVLLSGDGADECFGGYSWYSELLNTKPIVFNSDKNISFQSFGITLKNRLAVLNSYIAQKRAWAWHYYASENEKALLFSDDIIKNSSSSLRWFNLYKQSDNWSAEDFIKQDRLFYFPNEMLKKVDRMTMAHSVEGRAPFAAPEILNLADKLKFKNCINGNILKWTLRKAFEDILPFEVFSRPKHGFNVPIDHWLKNEWRFLFDETFTENSELNKMGIINKKSREFAIKLLYDKEKLNGHTLFCFIMLNMWLKTNS